MFLFLLLLLPRIIFPFCCVTSSWVCPTREWWKVKRDTRQKILNWIKCFIIAFISFLDASTNFRQRRFIVPPVHCEDVSINCDAWEWSAWNLSLVVGGEIHKSVQPKTMIRAVFGQLFPSHDTFGSDNSYLWQSASTEFYHIWNSNYFELAVKWSHYWSAACCRQMI